jgi:hypothetical protein
VALKVFKAMRYAGQARNPTLPLAMLAGLHGAAELDDSKKQAASDNPGAGMAASGKR